MNKPRIYKIVTAALVLTCALVSFAKAETGDIRNLTLISNLNAMASTQPSESVCTRKIKVEHISSTERIEHVTTNCAQPKQFVGVIPVQKNKK